jgi:hypothetical protein
MLKIYLRSIIFASNCRVLNTFICLYLSLEVFPISQVLPGDRVVQLHPRHWVPLFSRLLRHSWAMLGLFLSSGHHTKINNNNNNNVRRSIRYIGCLQIFSMSRVSSGSTVSDYGRDDRAIGVRLPAGAKDSSCSLCVQTGSGAHPASCPMGIGGPFPGGKSAAGAWRWRLTPI